MATFLTIWTHVRGTEEALNQVSCEIWVSQVEIDSSPHNRLLLEWRYAPYRSDEISAHIAAPPDEISQHFAYFIRGSKNIKRFWAGVHGATLYDGPIVASPIILGRRIINDGHSKVRPIAWYMFVKYEKTGAVNIKRWRYLYETAIRAWKLMVFDSGALKIFRNFILDNKDEEQVAPVSPRGQGAISASKKDLKANQIAITQNLRILSQKEDGDQRILDFLTNELYGRRRLQGFKTITHHQRELVTKLMWTGDSLDERNTWIRCIQEELARPIDASDDDSDSPHEKDYTLTSSDTETAGDKLEIQQKEPFQKTLKMSDAKNQTADSALGNNVQGTRKTYRLGISHSGTRIPVDPAGKEVTRLIPLIQLGSTYEQYLRMKCTIQEQYYGHETSPSDPDPHHGVPTKERFSGSNLKVQEHSDSHSDGDGCDEDSTHEAGDKKREISYHDEDTKKAQSTKMELAMNQLLDRPDADSSKWFVSLVVDCAAFGMADYELKREIAIQSLVDGSGTGGKTKSQIEGYVDSFLRRSTAEAEWGSAGLGRDENWMLKMTGDEASGGNFDDWMSDDPLEVHEGNGEKMDVYEEQIKVEDGGGTRIPENDEGSFWLEESLQEIEQREKTDEDIFSSSEFLPVDEPEDGI